MVPTPLDPSGITFVAAFAGGVVSFLSPCVLPLVPAYMALISGDIGGEAGESTDTGINRSLRVTRDTSLFVLGFGAVFVALGATATTLGQALFDNQA